MVNTVDIKVSISCITYNQKKYIRKALDSFLMQKTSFAYEIIVHDDASTDGTAEIVKEYAEKYPDKIKAILQKENQFSKRKRIFAEYIAPKIRGKYVAFCEGDDYWTDSCKLQKQYEAMEQQPGCVAAVHSVQGISEDESKLIRKFPEIQMNMGVIRGKNVAELILKDNEWLFHTSSYFIRTEVLRNAIEENMEFYMKPVFGDESMMLLCAMNGEFYYIDEVMSNYRMGAIGSTVANEARKRNHLQQKEKYDRVLKNFDEVSEGRFHEFVEIALKRNDLLIHIEKKEFKEAMSREFREFFAKLPIVTKLHVYMGRYIPGGDKIYYWLRSVLKEKRQ